MKKDKPIEITLEHHRGQGLPFPYEVKKLVNAVVAVCQDPKDHNKEINARVGDRISEAHAQELVEAFKVVTV